MDQPLSMKAKTMLEKYLSEKGFSVVEYKDTKRSPVFVIGIITDGSNADMAYQLKFTSEVFDSTYKEDTTGSKNVKIVGIKPYIETDDLDLDGNLKPKNHVEISFKACFDVRNHSKL